MREVDIQRAVATYLDHLPGVLWCHVANERKTATRRRGGFFTGQGVKSGVPDILIFNPNGYFSGMALELKSAKGKVSENQKKWLNALGARGWYTAVAYSFDQAQLIINEYLAGKATT